MHASMSGRTIGHQATILFPVCNHYFLYILLQPQYSMLLIIPYIDKAKVVYPLQPLNSQFWPVIAFSDHHVAAWLAYLLSITILSNIGHLLSPGSAMWCHLKVLHDQTEVLIYTIVLIYSLASYEKGKLLLAWTWGFSTNILFAANCTKYESEFDIKQWIFVYTQLYWYSMSSFWKYEPYCVCHFFGICSNSIGIPLLLFSSRMGAGQSPIS